MEALSFVTHPLDINPFEVLVRNKALPDWFVTLVTTVERHRGFLAGGLARILARDVFGFCDVYRLKPSSWISMYMRLDEPVDDENVWDFKTRADADFFFEAPDGIKRCVHELVEQGLSLHVEGTTPSGFATEYRVNDVLKMQLISGNCGPVEHVIGDFDIVNAAVAIKSDRVVYPGQRWLDLERAHMLHVSNWRNDYTVFRIMKWMDRHGIKKLTDETADEATEATIRLLASAKRNGGKVPALGPHGFERNTFLLSRSFQALLSQRKDRLSNDDLLWLASVWPDDLKAYNAAFEALRERSLASLDKRKAGQLA